MKIALLGDMALVGRYSLTSDSKVMSRLAVVADAIKDCDYAIANLESPLTNKKHSHVCKGVYLKSDTENVKTLTELGITHVTLANNHSFDYGVKGVKDTVRILNEAGIKYVGLGDDPVLLEKGNDRALLDGFCCYSANGVHYGTKKMHTKLMSEETVVEMLDKAKKENALPIVSAHYGIEGVYHPSPEHRKFFRSLSEKYDYVLHGNHPHRIQGYEKYNNSMLFYACGDLCFDDALVTSIKVTARQADATRQSYIAIITVEGNTCTDTEVIALTDLPDGIQHLSAEILSSVNQYSEDLAKEDSEIVAIRKETLINRSKRSTRKKSGIMFYLNRMNYKYAGAYINGKLHAKEYRKTFSKYL